MDIKLGNLKLSLGIIITIVLQAAGLIWYVSSLDSQMNANTAQIEELQAQLERHQEMDATSSADLEERLDDIEQIQKVIDNEMRTIMSDHEGFGDVLKQLNQAGLLPSGEKRQYGDYY